MHFPPPFDVPNLNEYWSRQMLTTKTYDPRSFVRGQLLRLVNAL